MRVSFWILLSAGGFACYGQVVPPPPLPPPVRPRPEPRIEALYEVAFRHIDFLKKKGDEANLKGQRNSYRSIYKNRARLSQTQADQLENVAAACLLDITAVDARALQIIARSKALYPGGRLLPGERRPQPPLELVALQKERDALILASRDRLRQAFGEQEFARFEQSLKDRFAPPAARVSVPQGLTAEPQLGTRPEAAVTPVPEPGRSGPR